MKTTNVKSGIRKKRLEPLDSHILIIDEHTKRRQMLVNMIRDISDPKLCLEARSAEEAARKVDTERVEFAIVDISDDITEANWLTEEIKLCCPNLPVLAFAVDDAQSVDSALSEEQVERILSGIRYVQSLAKSGVLGFTVFVGLESEP